MVKDPVKYCQSDNYTVRALRIREVYRVDTEMEETSSIVECIDTTTVYSTGLIQPPSKSHYLVT